MRNLSNMKLSCALDTVELSDIDQRICIEGIYDEASDQPLPQNSGILLRNEREKLTITVKLKIKEPNLAENQMLRELVNGWAAKGGWLTTNIHEGQRLHVECVKLLSGNAPNWEISRQLTFVSSGLAYWQDASAVTASASGASSGSVSLSPTGTRASYLEAEITNKGLSDMTSVQFSANGYTILFQGLSVAANGKLTVGYDDLHRMFAKVGSTHVLGKRTGQSADHVLLNPRSANTITYTASQQCNAKFSARGVYE